MTRLAEIYRPSLALLTDLYQLTMAYGYWKAGKASQEAVFHLIFRSNPFGGGFSVACGLASVVEFLRGLRYEEEDVEYLRGLGGSDGTPLFDAGFLALLRELRLECDVDAVPEGTVVFPYEPLVRVRGPILQAQILETPLLNLINFQTLVATKAARVCLAAQGEPVLEFGMRRAQGIDGALSAARAAYVGGCSATSNVLAGRLFGIPVKGTHAHSWVMAFDDEREAFDAWARAMPNNAVFLVDTYDSLEGVRRALEVGAWLRQQGRELGGIRLDSGDLAYLSIEARRLLDEAGFPDAKIIASNELDENIITSLKDQGARISVWGVGTRLVTGHENPSLGCVYKLSAIRKNGSAEWEHKVKLSEQSAKTSNPGVQQVRRFRQDGVFLADAIYDETRPLPREPIVIDPTDPARRKRVGAETPYEDLLVPVARGGRIVYEPPPLAAARERTQEQIASLHPGIRRFVNPHRYPAGLESGLYELKTRLMLELKGLS